MEKATSFLGKRGQSWSVDALIAIGVILFVVGIVYYTSFSDTSKEVFDLKTESFKLAKVLESDNIGLVDTYTLNSSQLLWLAQYEQQYGYEALKELLKMQSDFCLFLKDGEGNVLPIIDSQNNVFYVGVGSPNLYFVDDLNNKYYCGRDYTYSSDSGIPPVKGMN